MRLKDCLELGQECGLDFVGESLINVDIHSISLFSFDKVNEELKELNEEYASYREAEAYMDFSTKIDEALKFIEEREKREKELKNENN